jgi:hypothetical protein
LIYTVLCSVVLSLVPSARAADATTEAADAAKAYVERLKAGRREAGGDRVVGRRRDAEQRVRD